jgi:hypothetical protein
VPAQPLPPITAGVPRQCVVLVVAHYCESRTAVEHASNDADRFRDLRATIDEISHEERLTGTAGIPPRAVPPTVAKASEETTKRRRVAMNVTNNVEHSCNWNRSAGEFQA